MISLSCYYDQFFSIWQKFCLELRGGNHLQRTNIQIQILAANPLRQSRNKNMVPYSNLAKSIKISYYFQENRIGLPGVTLVLCRLCRIYTSQINIYLFAKSHHLLNAHQP